jgi:hypothetical protein
LERKREIIEKSARRESGMKKFRIFVLWLILVTTTCPVFALDFALTPAGADLLRERGSVGYLYWGFYREC